MKLFLLVLVFVIFIFQANSQSNNDKLLKALGKERFENLQLYPDSINYFNFILEDGFDIILNKYIDVEKLSNATTITLPQEYIENNVPQKHKINVLLLPVKFEKSEYVHYLIKGTDYILRLKSLEYIEKKYKAKYK